MGELGGALSNTIQYTLGGKEVTVSKMTVGILADFETAMASRDLQRGLKALGDSTPQERAEFIWWSQKRQDVRDALDAIESAEGMRLMLWLMLRAGGNDITEAEVGEMLTIDSMQEITALFTMLMDNGSVEIPGDSPNAGTTTEEAGTPLSPDYAKPEE